MKKPNMKITIKFDPTKRKMSPEELQGYLKAKRQGNGVHKSKKAYNRQKNKKLASNY